MQDEQYLYVGRMIALSVLHGGPGPVFFSPVVVDYLFGGVPLVKPKIDDVPDKTLQGKVCCCCSCVLTVAGLTVPLPCSPYDA